MTTVVEAMPGTGRVSDNGDLLPFTGGVEGAAVRGRRSSLSNVTESIEDPGVDRRDEDEEVRGRSPLMVVGDLTIPVVDRNKAAPPVEALDSGCSRCCLEPCLAVAIRCALAAIAPCRPVAG